MSQRKTMTTVDGFLKFIIVAQKNDLLMGVYKLQSK